jgi:hypothetical protein
MSDEDLIDVAKEATFTYHIAIQGSSFNVSDCTFKLISKFF